MTKTQDRVMLSEADQRQISDEARIRREQPTTDKFDDMDRAALCAALAEYELDCEGMTDDEVRSELRNLDADAEAEAEYENRKRLAETEAARIEQEHPMARPVKAVVIGPANQELGKTGMLKNGHARCPHCETPTLQGDNVTEYEELSPGSQRDTVQKYTCNECAGEWGPVVDKPKTARRHSGSSNGLKIEQNRDTANGVTRPSAGGKCRAVWDMLDAIGPDATAKQAREQAATNGFDKTTTMVQFYRWRKFNGVTGRQ